MCFWYSFRVVAPTQRSSPRASIGFSMLEASIEPSAAPAPTMVCSSSMNRMTSPCDSWTSLSTAFRRSSNSPRYLAPAISAPRSRATTRLFFSDSGTSPETMRWARPSTIAVLPTPGLADEHGVVLGAAGEDLHHAAHLVVAADDGVELALAGQLGEVAAVALERLVAVLGVGVVDALVAADLAQHVAARASRVDAVPLQDLARPASSPSTSASSRCSVETYWSLSASASRRASLRTRVELGRDLGGARPASAAAPPSARSTSCDDGAGRHAHLAEGRGDDAALLVEQRLQQVLGRDLRVVALLGLGLGGGERLLGLDGELVHAHVYVLQDRI